MTDPQPLVILARLMQVAQQLEHDVPVQIEDACKIPDERALGSFDTTLLLEHYQLATAFLEEAVAALRSLRSLLAHKAGALMPTREAAKPWGVVRREPDNGWSEWDHEGLLRALAPKVASSLGLSTIEVRGVLEAMPARLEWQPGALRDEWGEDPEEYAKHTTGRRTIRTQRTDKLAAVASDLTDERTDHD